MASKEKGKVKRKHGAKEERGTPERKKEKGKYFFLVNCKYRTTHIVIEHTYFNIYAHCLPTLKKKKKKTIRKKKLKRKMLLHHMRLGKKRKQRVSKQKPKKSKKCY